MSAEYDKAYFDKWYRHPHHRVKTPVELRRQVTFVVGMAEWVLGRPVKSVLDVGCGEGQWLPELRRIRRRVHYDGVDPSAYAVSRYGQRRRLQQGGIEHLGMLNLLPAYDLVVCCGMLNYLAPQVLRAGLTQVAQRTDGVAYLELFTRADRIEGDTNWPTPRTGPWYRAALRTAGFTSIGMHGYVLTAQQSRVAVLERGV